MGATGSESSDSDDIAASLVDPQRFAAVVDRHFAEIFRYLARRVGRDNAEDLGAETFVVAFSAAASRGERNKLGEFLYGHHILKRRPRSSVEASLDSF
jgi:DNA-directed RNA polymerase specialized sigma24 family protein